MSYALTLRNGENTVVSDAETAALVSIAAAKDRCRSEIIALYPTIWQLNAANGLKSEPEVAAMRAHILACKAVEDAYTAAVEAIIAGAGTDAEKITTIAAL